MKKSIAIYLMLTASSTCIAQPYAPEQYMRQVQRSHIEGNVPPVEQFDAMLRRYLSSYFNTQSVSYEFLRNGPTQSGVSYPKYYLWIRAIRPNEIAEGAVRLAAIEKTHFEVTDFISSSQIRADPERVAQIFPAPLVSSILAKAGAK